MKKKPTIILQHYGQPKEKASLAEKIILTVLIASLVFAVGYGIYNLCTI